MKIRIATIKDAENIRNIYAPYVMNTAVSFEYELPDTEEFTNRIENTLNNYPYLVAMVNDEVVGYACIASADKSDEYLTDDSEKFHTKMGFSLAGRHKQCGYKFGKWYDIIWMDKVIQEIPDIPEDFIPFSQLNSAFINIPK